MKIAFLLLVGILAVSACTQSTGYATNTQNSPLPKNVQQQEGAVEGMVGNEIGQTPPDFNVTAIDGRTIKLNEYARDKPTIVYFMATWCPFCARDFATLEQVFPEYNDKINFLNIGLDLTENEEILRNYKSRKYIPGELAPGAQKILIDYQVRSTTTKYLIKDGEIIFKNSGAMSADQWRRLLNALLSA